MSVFFCDSNCELSYKQIDEQKICVIRMPYTVNGEQDYYDMGRGGGNKAFFDKMRAGASIKTQALNQTDYIGYFEPILKKGQNILYVTFSHKMSATFESMKAAIDELKIKYPENTVKWADSFGISLGAGIIVYEAAKLHNEGKSDDEVIKFVETLRNRLKVFCTVNDLVYLKRGGRLSGFKAMMGSILNIKPIIEMKNGILESSDKEKGRKKALNHILERMESENADLSFPVVIIDADCPDEAESFKAQILEKYPEADVWRMPIGPVIGCHCGPDTIGLVFIGK